MNIPLPVAGSEAVPTEDMDPVIQNLVDYLTKAPQVNKCFLLNLKLQSTSVHCVLVYIVIRAVFTLGGSATAQSSVQGLEQPHQADGGQELGVLGGHDEGEEGREGSLQRYLIRPYFRTI